MHLGGGGIYYLEMAISPITEVTFISETEQYYAKNIADNLCKAVKCLIEVTCIVGSIWKGSRYCIY